MLDAYWDTTSSGLTNSACASGKTTSELQTPTGYTGIFAAWDFDIDGDGADDEIWDFGTASQYPILRYCADKDDIENTALMKTYGDKTGKEYCPLREVEQHGR